MYKNVLQIIDGARIDDATLSNMNKIKSMCKDAGINYVLVSDCNVLMDSDIVFQNIEELRDGMDDFYPGFSCARPFLIPREYNLMAIYYMNIMPDTLYINSKFNVVSLPVISEQGTHATYTDIGSCMVSLDAVASIGSNNQGISDLSSTIITYLADTVANIGYIGAVDDILSMTSFAKKKEVRIFELRSEVNG